MCFHRIHASPPYDDYASLNDDNRYELADGKLELMSPAPSVTHQIISFEMQKLIAGSCGSDYIILSQCNWQ